MEDMSMKNAYKYSLIAVSMAVLVLSCQKNPELTAPEENPNLVTLTCAFPAIEDENGTKVTLDTEGKTAWEAEVDAIVFQGCPKDKEEHSIAPIIHTFTAAELSNPEVASFTVDLSSLRPDSDDEALGHDYNVAYPASIWSPYSSSHMYGRSSFSNTNKMLMAGYVDGSSIVLKHMTAAIVFKVAGDPGDYDTYTFEGNEDEVVGYTKLVVEVSKPNVTSYRKKYKTSSSGTSGPMTKISGTVVSDGSTVNTIFLPVNTKRSGDNPDYTYDGENENSANIVYLPTGFTIKLLKGGEIKKYITSTAPLTIRPGHMINLGELPAAKIHDYEAIPASEKASAMELSNPKSANCYVVDGGDDANKDKVFKFPAVKGNTYVSGGAAGTSVGEVVSVDIVWETWNNAESVTANSVIKVVDYKDGFVYFKMPSTLHAGNALIAAKDALGNILWSWHIWIPKTAPSYALYGLSENIVMLDRNIGALDNPLEDPEDAQNAGLFYQWGRKDPLRAVSSIAEGTLAKTAPADAWTTSSTQLTAANMHETPCVFITGSEDWISESDATLWADNKTVNDPCPVGFKVPKRSETSLFDYITPDATWKGWSINNDKNYFTIGKEEDSYAVFPFGHFSRSGGYDLKGDGASWFWTATNKGASEMTLARTMVLNVADAKINCSGQKKANGVYVRCVAE